MFAVTGENPKYRLFNMSTCAEDVVKEVEEWSAAHPRKTRQDVFLEQWPETYIRGDGYLDVCPLEVSALMESGGEVARMTDEYKWMQDEVCVNADCPMCADYCPVANTPGVCKYEERGDSDAQKGKRQTGAK